MERKKSELHIPIEEMEIDIVSEYDFGKIQNISVNVEKIPDNDENISDNTEDIFENVVVELPTSNRSQSKQSGFSEAFHITHDFLFV